MTKTILLVDDEEDIRITVKSLLEAKGYTVVTAINGDDCLEKIRNLKPDLILMDIMMPGMPVRDVVPQVQDIPVVFLSVVRTTEEEQEELLKAKNVRAYIQKPFDIDVLLKTIQDHLR